MSEKNKAVQIITCENHRFELQLQALQQILNANDLKDRSVVVVSIAGSYRTGKSFLLNFFLNYLRAEYKTHDISNWINDNVKQGFKWRGGKNPETNGIWIWPEIFTHNFENGDKVAIILLDTQGIFDHTSSMKDCISIFAISMLLSSVLCYNVMQNVEEDKLQHLQFFMNYAQFAMENSCKKEFQKLLFIVRDWQHECDHDFGYSKDFVDDLLAENAKQTNEMRTLRKQLRESIEDIAAFLMPYPEQMISEAEHFTGDIEQVDSDFIDNVKLLVPSIFAPENLIVKRINGHEVRVDVFARNIQTFVNLFNSDELPEPRSILDGTKDAFLQKWHNKCLEEYSKEMKKEFGKNESIFDEIALQKIHENIKDKSLTMFKKSATFGDLEQIKAWELKLSESIEAEFKNWSDINDERIEKEEKKSREQRKKILGYATTALSVVGVGAAAGSAAGFSVHSMIRR